MNSLSGKLPNAVGGATPAVPSVSSKALPSSCLEKTKAVFKRVVESTAFKVFVAVLLGSLAIGAGIIFGLPAAAPIAALIGTEVLLTALVVNAVAFSIFLGYHAGKKAGYWGLPTLAAPPPSAVAIPPASDVVPSVNERIDEAEAKKEKAAAEKAAEEKEAAAAVEAKRETEEVEAARKAEEQRRYITEAKELVALIQKEMREGPPLDKNQLDAVIEAKVKELSGLHDKITDDSAQKVIQGFISWVESERKRISESQILFQKGISYLLNKARECPPEEFQKYFAQANDLFNFSERTQFPRYSHACAASFIENATRQLCVIEELQYVKKNAILKAQYLEAMEVIQRQVVILNKQPITHDTLQHAVDLGQKLFEYVKPSQLNEEDQKELNAGIKKLHEEFERSKEVAGAYLFKAPLWADIEKLCKEEADIKAGKTEVEKAQRITHRVLRIVQVQELLQRLKAKGTVSFPQDQAVEASAAAFSDLLKVIVENEEDRTIKLLTGKGSLTTEEEASRYKGVVAKKVAEHLLLKKGIAGARDLYKMLNRFPKPDIWNRMLADPQFKTLIDKLNDLYGRKIADVLHEKFPAVTEENVLTQIQDAMHVITLPCRADTYKNIRTKYDELLLLIKSPLVEMLDGFLKVRFNTDLQTVTTQMATVLPDLLVEESRALIPQIVFTGEKGKAPTVLTALSEVNTSELSFVNGITPDKLRSIKQDSPVVKAMVEDLKSISTLSGKVSNKFSSVIEPMLKYNQINFKALVEFFNSPEYQQYVKIMALYVGKYSGRMEQLKGQIPDGFAAIAITPVQRLPRWEILMKALAEQTAKADPTSKAAGDALTSLFAYGAKLSNDLAALIPLGAAPKY